MNHSELNIGRVFTSGLSPSQPFLMGVTQHCPSKRDIPKYGGEGHNVATWFYAIDEKR